MMPQPDKQTIAIHILSNISRSKGNQVRKFGQLLEYNIRNIFLEISSTKYGGEPIPSSFSQRSKLSISLDQSLHKKWSFLLRSFSVNVTKSAF